MIIVFLLIVFLKLVMGIKTLSFMNFGVSNCVINSNFGFIGSGTQNCIDAVGANHSFIGGGAQNVIRSSCSAILGGDGNTVAAGFTHVGMFGSGLNTCSSFTFHVNCLNAVNTPPYNPGLPVGTIYFIPVGAPVPAGACALYIR